MPLDQRRSAILHQVLNTTSYVTCGELTEQLKISRRTLYYDIEKINGWLKETGLTPIKRRRSAGFYLEDQTKKMLTSEIKTLTISSYEYSPSERQARVILRILTRNRRLLLQNFIDENHVSRNTAIQDMKHIRDKLKTFGIVLSFTKEKGYFFSGIEQQKRKLLAEYANQLMQKSSSTAAVTDLCPDPAACEQQIQTMRSMLLTFEKLLHMKFADHVLAGLSVHFTLFLIRLKAGKEITLEQEEQSAIRQTKEYEAAVRAAAAELPENAFISDQEMCYFTIHLLGAKISQFPASSLIAGELDAVHDIADKMIVDFQRYACVLFQDSEHLKKHLVLHLKSAYYRIKYDITPHESDVAASIKTKYSDIFCLTKKVVHHLQKALRKPVSSEETAFIAMHFGGWMKREGVAPSLRKTAVIVCPGGIGTSKILQSQIEDLLPNIDILKTVSSRVYETMTLETDVLISTVPLPDRGVPVLIVNPILNSKEKISLLKKVDALSNSAPHFHPSVHDIMSIIEKHAEGNIHKTALMQELTEYLGQPHKHEKEANRKPMLAELMTPNHITMADSAPCWEDAVRMAAKPLLDDGSVTPQYVDAMIATIQTLGPYIVITPNVAIPHARPEDGVNQIGMSFLRLNQAVSFSDRPEHSVQLIIVLAAIDNDTHLKALSQLTNMLGDPENIQLLINAQSAEDVLPMIQKYSN
ncbi:BglG family transcription antiterminator [Bacillus halotolerans]|uniref:BglG family transcription antiterminator n=2 Tax=Bacillus halotolerans TaxID=260554 RepID=UPI00084AF8D0|nr:BglG family transcription antiterminator [Bacillus halotolerans]MEC0250069.1 BglG family transcription antiterminator [Bacillus halotolerans]MEC0357970.1 BglG family transcription antiterminator [Bacillus halotolerans]OEC79121.1 transcription antiterminator BglG [Bacillus halotolerans]